jgi:hypothetical protein
MGIQEKLGSLPLPSRSCRLVWAFLVVDLRLYFVRLVVMFYSVIFLVLKVAKPCLFLIVFLFSILYIKVPCRNVWVVVFAQLVVEAAHEKNT